MNFNWPIIGDKIFGILKGTGFKLQMFDKFGDKTLDPHEATRFFATISSNDPKLKSISILLSIHDENANSHLDIKTPDLDNEKDFEFIKKLKDNLKTNVGDREGLSVNWYKFDHTIKPKDEEINNITESKDISKPFGSTKSSYQRIGEAKLIIRHSESVNEEKVGSRWRQVKSIFIENKEGERFKYPHTHIAGARAMARHISNGGTMHDDIGSAIQGLSEDYMSLKKSARMLRSAGDESRTNCIKEVLHHINKQVKSLSGPRGYNSVSSTLTEKMNVDETLVNEIYSDLLEKCECNSTDEDVKCLKTAAKYLADSKNQFRSAEKICEFNRQPDLVSKISEFKDQKSRLAWQVEEMASCVANQDLSEKLYMIANSLRNQATLDPESIKLVREVYKASKGLQESFANENSDLQRIKKLSGI